MAETRLLIPINDAARWDWLEEDLYRAAEEAGIDGYDGGEEEGDVEVHIFDGLAPKRVQALVDPVLANRAPRGTRAVITGKREVTVRTDQPAAWLQALGPASHPYDKAIRRLVQRAVADPVLTKWWCQTPYDRLAFHQALASRRRPGWIAQDSEEGELLATVALDIHILDTVKPSPEEVEQIARTNFRLVLNRAAAHVGVPLPAGSFLDN